MWQMMLLLKTHPSCWGRKYKWHLLHLSAYIFHAGSTRPPAKSFCQVRKSFKKHNLVGHFGLGIVWLTAPYCIITGKKILSDKERSKKGLFRQTPTLHSHKANHNFHGWWLLTAKKSGLVFWMNCIRKELHFQRQFIYVIPPQDASKLFFMENFCTFSWLLSNISAAQ